MLDLTAFPRQSSATGLPSFIDPLGSVSLSGLGLFSSVKLDRYRGDHYGDDEEGHGYNRHPRGPSRFPDSPLSQNRRPSPSSFRVPLSGGNRSFDSPPSHGPGGVGGFRHVDGRGGVGDGFDPIGAGGGGRGRGFEQNFEVPLQPAPAPPITGQKRAFPFPGTGGSPGSDRLDGPGFAKLFIGSVPRTATEEEIRPPFEEYGNVIEVALIKDKRTGQQQGCCFIKYATSEEADRAIRGLHNQYTLPGGVGPVQVRYADGERERLGATEFKLFVGSLHKQATEPEVREIFSPYGQVEDVYLMRDEFRQSRGCGFVKYAQRDMALAAINALNGIYTMRGCDQPLIIRFADPKRPRPGDSRGGPSFGGPGFGPRFQSPGSSARPPPNSFNDFNGDRVPPNAWRPMAAAEQGKPLNAGQFSRPNDVGISQNPNGSVSAPAPSAQMQKQAFNQPFQQYPPGGQKISPLKNSLQSPQQLTPPLKSQPQPAPSYPQNQTSHGQQSGQQQSPFKPPQFGAQTSVQKNASSVTALQAPPLSINLQTQPRPSAAANQQQMRPPSNQQLLQPLQSPSPMAQMLSQQTQTLQASFQSSQQAFSQIQQQLQMMQPPNQNMAMQQQQQQQQQQSTHTTNQQNHWAKSGGGPPTAARPTGAAEAPSSSANVAPVKCSWTEHTSPDGFKYYYNSATGESRWVEPEELRLFKQQQLQQQKPQAQLAQPQAQSYPPHILPTQQVQQPSQMQPPLHQQQQHHPQQRLQQSQLPSQSPYHASGAMSCQNVQEVAYPQYQVRPHPMNDPARRQQQQQSVSSAQEWMWNNNNVNNKQTTALEELN